MKTDAALLKISSLNAITITWKSNRNWEKVMSATEEMLKAAQNNDVLAVLKAADDGAEIDAVDTKGNTALMNMAAHGNLVGVNGLLDRRANADLTNPNVNTAAHIALLNHAYKAFEVLIERGASSNIKDRVGNTVVHVTASTGYTYGLERCLEKGGDAKITNNKGQNATDLAAVKDKYHAVDVLIKAGIPLSDGSPDLTAWLQKRRQNQAKVTPDVASNTRSRFG